MEAGSNVLHAKRAYIKQLNKSRVRKARNIFAISPVKHDGAIKSFPARNIRTGQEDFSDIEIYS